MHRFALFSALLLVSAVVSVRAQSTISPNDSVFRRARRLVSEGNGAAGRALADSMLKREQEGSTSYGNALYWRGALAETAAEAERDYRRVIVEYPVSAYADDALLAIAELEQARGDRAGALQHLQRFVKEHPVSPARGTAAFAAARLAFEQRDTRGGCAMITEARASVSSTDVELRNQIDYFASRCVDTGKNAPVAGAPITSAPVTSARDSMMPATAPKKTAAQDAPKRVVSAKPAQATTAKAAKDKTPAAPTPSTITEAPSSAAPAAPSPAAKPAATERGSYTIQLAAFNTRGDAEHLVTKLAANGVKARVSGATKPFRVRLDFYPTHQAALDAVALLKQRGIIGFVTTEELAPERKTP